MNLLDSLIEDQLLLPPLLNGTEQRREVWICIRTDDVSGDGSRENPYNGSTASRFDALMRDGTRITSNMTIRLGPGVFQTQGGDGNAFAGQWRPRSGQRIVGSGIYATILQLIDAGTTAQGVSQNMVCNSNDINNFEISDLTLDGNLARQINPLGDPAFNNVMVGCVAINGRNNRILRVRAINFGSRVPATAAIGALECFPLWLSIGTQSLVAKAIRSLKTVSRSCQTRRMEVKQLVSAYIAIHRRPLKAHPASSVIVT